MGKKKRAIKEKRVVFRKLTKKSKPIAGTTKHLTTLPPDIHLLVIDNLGPVTSTCFGLTCKRFYALHYKVNGMVNLNTRLMPDGLAVYHLFRDVGDDGLNCSHAVLGHVLDEYGWFGKTLKYSNKRNRFVRVVRVGDGEDNWFFWEDIGRYIW